MNRKVLIALLVVLLGALIITPVYAGFSYVIDSKSESFNNNSFGINNWVYYQEEFPLDTPDGEANKNLVDSILAGPNANNNGLLNEDSKLNQLFTYSNSKKIDFHLTSEDKILVDGKYIKVRDFLAQPSDMYFVLVRETGNWFNQSYSIYSTNNIGRGTWVKPVYKTTLKWYYNFGNSYYEVEKSEAGRAKAISIKGRNEQNDFEEYGRKVNFFDYNTWEHTK